MPVRELVASSESRVEPIVYWTRLGDDLPTNGSEQRWAKLRQQMHGLVTDGVLVRLSTVSEPDPSVFAGLRDFGTAMVRSIAASNRAALIGRPLAAAMGR
jgi:EpsI family protein